MDCSDRVVDELTEELLDVEVVVDEPLFVTVLVVVLVTVDDVVLVDVLEVVLVVLVVVAKLAVIVPGPLITAEVWEDCASEGDIEPLTVQSEKTYPLAEEATTCNVEPASYQELPWGKVVPALLGALEIPTRY